MQERRHQKSYVQDFASHSQSLMDHHSHRVLNLSHSHSPFSSSSFSKHFSSRFLHPHPHLPFRISSSDSENFHIPSSAKQCVGKGCVDNKVASCNYEVEEWLKHAQKFSKPNNFMSRQDSSSDGGDSLDQNRRNSGDKLSISSICKNLIDHEPYSKKWPSVKDSTAYPSQSRLTFKNRMQGHFKSKRDRGQGRPKPYSAYLNEIEMQKLESERDSRKRARHHELLQRMRRKEAAIDDWELEQTMMAVERMKKIEKKFEKKLEKKQVKIAAQTQKKLGSLKQKAEKQKRNLRRTTIQKISTTKNAWSFRGLFTCFKFGSFC